MEDALAQVGAPLTVELAPYGQVVEQLLSQGSAFARNPGGINVALVRISDWAPTAVTRRVAEERLDALAAAVVESRATAGAPLVVGICPDVPDRSRPALPGELGRRLAELADVAVVDVTAWFSAYEVADVFDPDSDDIAHIPYTDEAFAAIATGLCRVVASTRRPPKKVIAVDCDNTLWGGACGDQRPGELELSEPYQSVQRFLRTRYEAGFMLAICSRNDEVNVDRVFRERAAELALTREMFVARRINWAPKWENLTALAEQLRVGVDSFVLVDDDPFVCAETGQRLPQVTVVQVGAPDSATALARCWELDRFFVTVEDRLRNQTYQTEALRAAEAATAAGLAELNQRLATRIEVRRAGPADAARVEQLLARTNQFASGTLPAVELRQALRGADWVWVATLRDKFGDYGVVATAIAVRDTTGLVVRAFAMSCRVLERGVAEALFGAIGDHARDAGLAGCTVCFRPTGRNQLAREFLACLALPIQEGVQWHATGS